MKPFTSMPTILSLALLGCGLDASKPTVELSATPGQLSSAGQIRLLANATDNTGISKVEFFRIKPSGIISDIATLKAKPYEAVVLLGPDDNGKVAFVAKAYDARGNVGESQTVEVTVAIDATPPEVTLTTNDPNITAAGSVTLTALASDASGIAKVEFFKGQTSLSTDTLAPFQQTLNFTSADNGTPAYSALATDNNGNASQSLPISLTINIRTLGLSASFISPGRSGHTCAIKNDGTSYCWGKNRSGQLGLDSLSNTSVPKALIYPPELSSFRQISVGATHTCGIGSNGKTYCWGANGDRAILGGSTAGTTAPAEVLLPTPLQEISAGYSHTCAISASKTYCWGDNSVGLLGNGSNAISSIPVAVSLPQGVTAFTRVSVGYVHSCALSTDDRAFCWGANTYSQLGNGENSNSQSPIPVTASNITFKQVAAGGFHTCALTPSGKAYCWGDNSSGQLGNGLRVLAKIPMLVNMPLGVNAFSQISAGRDHTCAIDVGGNAYCWGNGKYGQLGNGNPYIFTLPRKVALPESVRTFSRIAAGEQTTCAIASNGKAYCWGSNEFGQLGDGSLRDSFVPVLVVAP
jgi:alpha-tubulin suppressor-like RCC1 family protein